MNSKSKPVPPLLALVCALAIPLALAPMGHAQPVTQTLAPVSLRGYGTVSGIYKALPNGASSLEISCQSPAQAQLTQAKYLSDLGVLPGVQFKNDGVALARGQGAIVAARQGSKVTILAAPDETSLCALMKQTFVGAAPSLKAEVAVPMWLDRFDKFNFRHYYRAWEPREGTDANTYDYLSEFDFAQRNQRAGFVFWNDTLASDTAEGMMNHHWWEWAAKAARERDLPIGLNAMFESQTWLLNRYREQTQQKMPGFVGNFYDLKSPYLGGQGQVSWNATTAEDARLGLMQSSIRHFVTNYPDITSILEPHGELNHGPQDVFLEYGPVADASYRKYLAKKYKTPAAVGARWKRDVKSWDEVRVPEIASFAGLNADALDLGGLWSVGYEELTQPARSPYYYGRWEGAASKPAPAEWFAPAFDDAAWPQISAPGDDRALYLEKRPAVLRRHFEVSDAWKAAHPRVWMVVWDLDGAANQEVRAVLNGREVGRDKVLFNRPHWNTVEVTEALQVGENVLALRLPQGVLSYKAYLSSVEPAQYPHLGAGRNAQWVDFSDWMQWSRIEAVRGGAQMIRQAAPNQQIVFMAPTVYADGIKKLALDYGGNFHDTGFMGGFWADYPASTMRGANLPVTVEPGNPGADVKEWRKQMGLYQTEGVRAVDYFIHVGNILWKPEIKADYEANRKQIALMGQSHYAKAQTAVLYSDRIAQLTGYPWGADPNSGLGGGYWAWNAASVLRGSFPYDGLTQSSFVRGEADPYRVIIDSNTSIMEPQMVGEIERFVRAGGTFVTLAQTGRSTPETPDSWPLAPLTGFRVTHIDRLKPDGGVDESAQLKIAPDQNVFDNTLDGVRANGLHLEKIAPEAKPLLLWPNGTIAAGVRPVGKGFIVQLGAKFTGASIFDRVEAGGQSDETRQLRQMLASVLKWRGVAPEAGTLQQQADWVLLRPAVTNNGLYDTWTMWNWSPDTAQTVTLKLDKSPAYAFEARDGKEMPITKAATGAQIELTLQPYETRVILTPRGQIGSAPLDWLNLQRGWWRGTISPGTEKLPAPPQRFARNLSEDWKFESVDAAADVAPMVAVSYDDKAWKTRELGVWEAAKLGQRALFRKTFTVPSEWKGGKVSLYLTSWFASSFVGQGRVWLDGREVKGMNDSPYIAIGLPSLAPGTTHTLAVEAQNAGVVAGLRGQTWISWEPEAPQKIDLAGAWQTSADGLKYGDAVQLPGKFDAQFLRRSVLVPANLRGKNAVLRVDGSQELVSVLINGTSVRRHHHKLGERWNLDLTPFVRFGAENEIQIVTWEKPAAGEVREVSLGFFDPKFYP